MSEEPRAPTPAVYRTSPLYDFYGETLYPYVNHKLGGFTPYISTTFDIQVPSKEPLLPLTPSQPSKFLPPMVSLWETDSGKDGGKLMYRINNLALSQQNHKGAPMVKPLRPFQKPQIRQTRRSPSDWSLPQTIIRKLPPSLHQNSRLIQDLPHCQWWQQGQVR